MEITLYLYLSLIFGAAITFLMTGVLLIQYKLGFEHSIRNEEGKVDMQKETTPGRLMSIMIFLLMTGIPVAAGLWLDRAADIQLSFWEYFLLCYGIFFVANLWDLLILDYLLLLKFRPPFLKLPDTPYYTTFKPHIQGWGRGLAIGIATSLVAAAICRVFI